ncbi:conserved hypothetical protein [Pediculus humanus corporis]|uniref:Uncharacterized protein n=1 Tax=Pediculus humanus subsp. corporis TaxID=121224 RepID=E0VQ80_PEDHC|nr:uncharacterized protein Phum_PHUM373370 [Pediculus humanus corporis]EEB15536.1 conserved hypothetical protein [Pediculus humanus corporis]
MFQKYSFPIPDKAFYVPDFITEEEEENILNNVYSSPKPKWTNLSNRRLQNWGGIPHLKGMIPEDIPAWLDKVLSKIKETNAFPKEKQPNHVLVNEYLPNQGIMRHLDGPIFTPVISTISCGSHTVLNFHPPLDKNEDCSKSKSIAMSILLERRSLVVIAEDLYHLYPHSICEKSEDVIHSDKIANLKMMC